MNIEINIDENEVKSVITNEIKELFTKYGSPLDSLIKIEAEKIIKTDEFVKLTIEYVKETSNKLMNSLTHDIVSEILKKKIKATAKQLVEEGDLFAEIKDEKNNK